MPDIIGRGRLYVRAQYEDGRYGSVDVHDLDDESFRAVVLGPLSQFFTLIREETKPVLRAKARLKKGDEN